MQKIAVGRVMMDLTRASLECGVRLPSELTMLGKALLHLDEIVRTLHPDFDPNQFIRSRAMELMALRMKKSVSAASAFSGLLD
jgi:predicted unusual protein kinase regulating ubiquinone biosynthesis (AarF/ABC1/UbiB family)